jgi:hypothetical protein
MRVVLVNGGVISGVGKGEFLILLDIFPVVSARDFLDQILTSDL